MKFLVDECLHTSLVGVAHECGYACDHVNYIGLSGCKDWRLMDRIRCSEYTLVTNNRVDFETLYGREELHAGLIIVIPSVAPKLQRELFSAALKHVGSRELVNTLLEVDTVGSEIVCREFLYPEP